jgi:esterase/lipase
MKKKYLFSVFCLIVFSILTVQSQNIIRRGFVGLKTIDINDSISKTIGLKNNKGVLVIEVFANSTSALLKMEANDFVKKINDKTISNKNEFIAATGKLRTGDEITISFIRKGKELNVKGKLNSLPMETSEKYEVLYDEVPFAGGYLRTITSKPKGNGPFKTIFFIQGYTCVSMDNLGKHPYGQLFDKLTEKGYVIMRSEKPGMGDNLNTPDCDQIGFTKEVEAFETAYKKLKSYSFVDTSNMVIFGHSLGGIEAPILAADFQPKGVIVIGTTAITWMEYLIQMFRFQNVVQGADYVENEEVIRQMIPLLDDILIKKKTPMELSKYVTFNKLMTEYMEYKNDNQLWSRNYTYWQQLQEMNMPQVWKNVNSNTLVVRGEGDFEAFSTQDHQIICDMVNHYHPGKGTFMLVPNMDHGFAKSKTPAESVSNAKIKGHYYNNFNENIIEIIDKWIKEKIN